MRLASTVVLVLALAAPALAQTHRQRPAAAPQQSSLEEDREAIGTLQERDIAANMALDVEKLLAIRTDDIVYLVPGRPPIVGSDAVRKYMEEVRRQLDNWDMLGYEETWQEVQVVGDYAVEWGTLNVRAKPSDANRESAAVRNIMQVLRRQPDGAWKIARVIWNVQSQQPASQPQPKPKD